MNRVDARMARAPSVVHLLISLGGLAVAIAVNLNGGRPILRIAVTAVSLTVTVLHARWALMSRPGHRVRFSDRAARVSPLVLLFMGLVADVIATIAGGVAFAVVHQKQVEQTRAQQQQTQQIVQVQRAAEAAVAKVEQAKRVELDRQLTATCGLVKVFISGPAPATAYGQHSRDSLVAYGRAFRCP